eukprot:scaffold303908_cov28-Tisochrysis_lutea.AAC.4
MDLLEHSLGRPLIGRDKHLAERRTQRFFRGGPNGCTKRRVNCRRDLSNGQRVHSTKRRKPTKTQSKCAQSRRRRRRVHATPWGQSTTARLGAARSAGPSPLWRYRAQWPSRQWRRWGP